MEVTVVVNSAVDSVVTLVVSKDVTSAVSAELITGRSHILESGERHRASTKTTYVSRNFLAFSSENIWLLNRRMIRPVLP